LAMAAAERKSWIYAATLNREANPTRRTEPALEWSKGVDRATSKIASTNTLDQHFSTSRVFLLTLTRGLATASARFQGCQTVVAADEWYSSRRGCSAKGLERACGRCGIIVAMVWMRMCAKNMVWLMRNAKRRVDGRRTDTHEVAKNETGDRPEAGRCTAIGSCLTCATI
jgi:hypothetical protein